MAKVYLLADVQNIGHKGAIVDVKDGFAANFLIPKRLGKLATTDEIQKASMATAHTEESAKKKLKVAQRLAATPQAVLVKSAVKIGVQTSAGGRVHGNVDGSVVLEEAMKNVAPLKGFEKSEMEVKLTQKIEYVGKYACELQITLVDEGVKTVTKVPLYIDVVSVSEAKRKTK